jgi:hypothetical protein
MRLACKHPLDDRELWEAECSVNILTDAVGLRISTLESRSYLSSNSILLIRVRATGHFVTHNLDPSKEFELAYNGMVSYMRRGVYSGSSDKRKSQFKMVYMCLHRGESESLNIC